MTKMQQKQKCHLTKNVCVCVWQPQMGHVNSLPPLPNGHQMEVGMGIKRGKCGVKYCLKRNCTVLNMCKISIQIHNTMLWERGSPQNQQNCVVKMHETLNLMCVGTKNVR